jgi:soluble lytic murein transglycosylase
MTAGADYNDLEWLSGYIALQGLRDPKKASEHFLNFWNGVATPISKGRGGYWLGRAHEAMGDKAEARKWYARGAEHPTSFYGQLAAEKIGLDIGPTLAGGAARDWRKASFADSDAARAVILLDRAGQDDRTRWFIEALAATLRTEAEIDAAGDLAQDIGRPDLAVSIGKDAAGRGLIALDAYYPIHEGLRARGPVEPAFAMAVARQESEMNPAAVSPAGARGLMQLMPATAQKVSRQVGLPYDQRRLTSDPAYNAKLGSTYLAEMMARFSGARILAAAAYNAGPGRVAEWIGTYGDPRDPDVDPIDWIESIPFNETRNYVHRVLEGLHVYRARLGSDMARSFEASLTRPQG